jgi:hypothetical protein
MADNATVVVGCSWGDENPDAIAGSFTAGAALGRAGVVPWLTAERVIKARHDLPEATIASGARATRRRGQAREAV